MQQGALADSRTICRYTFTGRRGIGGRAARSTVRHDLLDDHGSAADDGARPAARERAARTPRPARCLIGPLFPDDRRRRAAPPATQTAWRAHSPTAGPRRKFQPGTRPWRRRRSPVTIKRGQPRKDHEMGGPPPRRDGPGGRRDVAGGRTQESPARRIRGLGHCGSSSADLEQPLGGPASTRSAQEGEPTTNGRQRG